LDHLPASIGGFPCIFPLNRDYAFRDGFAEDCLHRQFLVIFQHPAAALGPFYSPLHTRVL
jgi:hypothetical protein